VTRWLAALLALASLLAPNPASARYLFEEGELSLELRSAFKGTFLLSAPLFDDPVLPRDPPQGAGLFRLRFDLTANLTEYVTVSIAYEHRAQAVSAANTGAGILVPTAPAPFRLEPLDWPLVDDGSYLHRHEFDRGFVALHLDFMELTVGRQAIGLGRGTLFSAVDIFAPFTPTEADREWRRGVDAVHAELRIPELSELSADFIAAFGNVTDDGLESVAVLGRLRAIVGDVDGALLVGRRGEDDLVGVVLSANVGDASVYGEGALYGTDGQGIDEGFLGTARVVAKGVLGGSYVVDVGSGLRLNAEYHYNGFGIANVGQDPSLLADDAFRARLARGDGQTLGRHTLAAIVSYDVFDDLSASLSWLQSPVDASGLVGLGVVWNHSDNVTVLLNTLVPWGSVPRGGIPTSEYGSAPFSVFLQARLYD
jgi:hypothetical protein